ncbi:MAG: phosphoglycolate phosphatase [Rhodobacteraceae bacterium]|nr:phosphoglycolate phosphatase [Paracoccaceae bacterium]
MSTAAETALIFDLDGTLIDSAPVIMMVANRLFEELRIKPLDLAETKSFVGSGAAALLEQSLASRGVETPAIVDAAFPRFEKFYVEFNPLENKPYPGVEAALRALVAEGFALGLCTNKPTPPTKAVVEALGWDDLFGAVICGDTLKVRKPDPEPLRTAFAELKRSNLIFIGDSEIDAETAQAAEAPLLLFTEGYRKSPVEALPHRAAFSDWTAFPALVSDTLAA